MEAKKAPQSAHSHSHARPNRTERRAAERVALKAQQGPERKPWSWQSMLSGGMVIVAALAFFAYLTFFNGGNKTNASTPLAAKPLVDSSAFLPGNILKTGTQAPNFTLRDDTGFTYSLGAQRGHPVVLEFYALWCPHCHREAAVMHQITQNYVQKGVRVWAILGNPYGQYYESSGGKNIDLASRSDFAWYARTYKVNYPVLVDPKFTVVNEYGQAGYPTLFMINGAGKIVYAHAGELPYASFAKTLNGILATPGH